MRTHTQTHRHTEGLLLPEEGFQIMSVPFTGLADSLAEVKEMRKSLWR